MSLLLVPLSATLFICFNSMKKLETIINNDVFFEDFITNSLII